MIVTRPTVLYQAMGCDRIGLFLDDVRITRRIRRRFMRLFETAIELVCLVGSGSELRSRLRDLLRRRADLEREALRDVSRRRTSIYRIRRTLGLAARIEIS